MIMVTSLLPSCTSVLGVMEPLLPETAEGGDTRARPNENARQGGVLGELEATDAARRQRKETSDTPRRRHTQDRAGELSTQYGGTVRDGGMHRSLSPMQSFILPAKVQHLPTPETSGERSSLTVLWTPPPITTIALAMDSTTPCSQMENEETQNHSPPPQTFIGQGEHSVFNPSIVLQNPQTQGF